MNKIMLALTVLSLPACYYTPMPSILLAGLAIASLVEAYILKEPEQANQTQLQLMQSEIEELQTQVTKLSLRAGFSLE